MSGFLWGSFLSVFLIAQGAVPVRPLPSAPLAGSGIDKSVQDLAASMNEFACDLYTKLKAGGRENLFFSPYSIEAALTMAYGGAKGATAEAMAETLHFSVEGEALHQRMGALLKSLNAAGKKGAVRLNVANALWLGKKETLLSSFRDLNRQYYRAGLERLDFRNDPEGARKRINAWVSKKTKRYIRKLIPKGLIDAMTSLVLTNAIVFDGKWQFRFKKARTRRRKFTRLDGSKVRVPMMRQTGNFRLYEDKNCSALLLPYDGFRWSMLVVLPRKTRGLPKLERRLDASWLAKLMRQSRSQKVHVSLPRFRLSQDFDLAKTLSDMGMGLAFTAKADFSGMNGIRDLFIGSVLHKAYVEVAEKGTRAAAATAVVMTKSISIGRPKVLTFKADHPFLFAIVDKPSGAILFMGRVMDPRR